VHVGKCDRNNCFAVCRGYLKVRTVKLQRLTPWIPPRSENGSIFLLKPLRASLRMNGGASGQSLGLVRCIERQRLSRPNPLTNAASWSAIIAFPYLSTRLVIDLVKFGEIISEDFGWWSTTGMLFVRHLRTRSVVTVEGGFTVHAMYSSERHYAKQ
jgi:hypothetical protein